MKAVSPKKRGFKALSLVLVSALILAACGNNADNAKPSPSSSGAGEGKSGEKITLTIGHTNVTDEPGAILFRDALKKFREDHPNVEIKEDGVSHDLYRSKMTTLGASGELPDVFLANGSMLIDFAPKGLVAKWDDILTQDKAWNDGFLQDAFEDFRINGNIYGVATQTLSVHLIFYNRKSSSKRASRRSPERGRNSKAPSSSSRKPASFRSRWATSRTCR